ncbi:MAG: ATP-binding protein [Actinomycetales bacterium]
MSRNPLIAWQASWRRLGLRRRVTLGFAAGSLVLASLLSGGTYLLARGYIIDQRVRSVSQQAYANAAIIRGGLLTSGLEVSDVLAAASPPSGTVQLVERRGTWYSSSLSSSASLVPEPLTEITARGEVAVQWLESNNEAAIAVGIPLPAANATYYQVTSAAELDRTLGILARVLLICTVLTAMLGALWGRWAATRLLVPLNDVAQAAARISAGELNTRLRPATDVDLATIATSINAMVDALAERIEREARFTADVAHELRSPLTTLTTSVQLMESRRDELPPTAQSALDLMSGELTRFRNMLEDLLELGRLDAGEVGTRTVTDLGALVLESLSLSGHDPSVLEVQGGPWWAEVDRRAMARALVNLQRNADVHGDGLRLVQVSGDGEHVQICVHDSGPGVPEADRGRIFDRFGRGGSRGSRPGVGLGLSLVAETVRAHGGTVTQSQSFLGGALFCITLDRAEAPMDPEQDDLDPAAPVGALAGPHGEPSNPAHSGPGKEGY